MKPGCVKNGRFAAMSCWHTLAVGKSHVVKNHRRENALHFAVTKQPKGDWTMVVRVDGDEVLKKLVEDTKWKEFRQQFDLLHEERRNPSSE